MSLVPSQEHGTRNCNTGLSCRSPVQTLKLVVQVSFEPGFPVSNLDGHTDGNLSQANEEHELLYGHASPSLHVLKDDHGPQMDGRNPKEHGLG